MRGWTWCLEDTDETRVSSPPQVVTAWSLGASGRIEHLTTCKLWNRETFALESTLSGKSCANYPQVVLKWTFHRSSHPP